GLEAYDLCFAPDLPVEFLDTAGFGFLEVTIPESRSTANPEEADLLLQRLVQLLKPCDTAAHQEDPLTIGVIAPYRAQINCLKDAIEVNEPLGGLLQQRLLSVGTVDSFQGQERDIIAISLTRSNHSGDIGFLSDIRRMNVGMTRARRKLLLVGETRPRSASIRSSRSCWPLLSASGATAQPGKCLISVDRTASAAASRSALGEQ
ncbi:MAG: hypothetical protein RL227_2067, partial [Pseudomonadota bacterium]